MGEALQIENLISRLSGEEQKQLEKRVAAIIGKNRWIPQEGPQTDAYFSDADETLFGGQAGGGKSHLLIGYALNEGQQSVVFRNGLGNLRDLENEAVKTLGHKEGFNQQTHYWRLPDDRGLEFASLEQPGSELNHQGRRRDFVGFDEASQMIKSRVQFVLGWSTGRVIYATNPPLSDQGNWLIKWFAPWLDPMFPQPAPNGELRWFVNNRDGDPVWVEGPGQHDRGDGVVSSAKSRTFIPSRLDDNKFLRDTDYRSRVEALPEPMRSAMLDGNFMAAREDHEYQIFPSSWLQAAQSRWTPRGKAGAMIAMGVDVAGGGKDREVIAPLHTGNWFDAPRKHVGVDTKDGAATGGRIVTEQRNGAPIAVDMTGGWGGAVKTFLSASGVDVIGIVFSEVTGAVDPNSKIPFGNLRAEMYWNFRLALDPKSGEDVALPLDALVLAEGSTPRWLMRGGKIWVESKDDIRARLGVSTDLFDAMVIAWHIRSRGIAKQQSRGRKGGNANYVEDMNPFATDGY